MTPDLKKEQKASCMRPRYRYTLAAKSFFFFLDLLTGKKITLSKVKLLEILASIPYRSWEIRQHAHMTRRYREEERKIMMRAREAQDNEYWHVLAGNKKMKEDGIRDPWYLYRGPGLVQEAREIMMRAREAQDNKYWHVLVVNEKMKEDGIKDPWYLIPPVPLIMVGFYTVLMYVIALTDIRRAFLFNAQFEDHAEHMYAQFVGEHPEWERQPVNNEQVKERQGLPTWADVFRRIGLDGRDHMNMSFVFSDKPEYVVTYDGMPGRPDLNHFKD